MMMVELPPPPSRHVNMSFELLYGHRRKRTHERMQRGEKSQCRDVNGNGHSIRMMDSFELLHSVEIGCSPWATDPLNW